MFLQEHLDQIMPELSRPLPLCPPARRFRTFSQFVPLEGDSGVGWQVPTPSQQTLSGTLGKVRPVRTSHPLLGLFLREQFQGRLGFAPFLTRPQFIQMFLKEHSGIFDTGAVTRKFHCGGEKMARSVPQEHWTCFAHNYSVCTANVHCF